MSIGNNHDPFFKDPVVSDKDRSNIAMLGAVVDAKQRIGAIALSSFLEGGPRSMSFELNSDGVSRAMAFIQDIPRAQTRRIVCCMDASTLKLLQQMFGEAQSDHEEAESFRARALQGESGFLRMSILPFYDSVVPAYFKYARGETGTVTQHASCLADIAMNKDLFRYLTLPGNPHSLQDLIQMLKHGSVPEMVTSGTEVFLVAVDGGHSAELVAGEFVSRAAMLSHLPEPICLKLTLLYVCRRFGFAFAYMPDLLGGEDSRVETTEGA